MAPDPSSHPSPAADDPAAKGAAPDGAVPDDATPEPQGPPPQSRGSRRLLVAVTVVVAAVLVAAAVGAVLARRTGDTLAEYGDGDLTFRLDTRAFSAVFPREPERRVQSQDAGDRQLQVISYVSGVDDGQLLAGYTDYPPEVLVGVDPAAILADAPERLTAQLQNGRVVRTREVTMVGVPAVEIEAEGTSEGRPAEMIARMFLRENRIFFLIVVGDEADPEAADRFFGSFALP